jgi:hypothetical protein
VERKDWIFVCLVLVVRRRRDVEGGGEVLGPLVAGGSGGGRDAVADGAPAARGGRVLDGRGAG